jgi:hypothetical protein
VLQLLLRPPGPGQRHALDDYLACLQAQPQDACGDRLGARLRENLAEGLSLEDPAVRDLAALSLNLLGYRGLSVPLDELPALSPAVFGGS